MAGKKQLERLVKKKVMGKDGKQHTVWVKPDGTPAGKQRPAAQQPQPQQRQPAQKPQLKEKQQKQEGVKDTAGKVGEPAKNKMSKMETNLKLTLAGVADAMEDKLSGATEKVKNWAEKQRSFYDGDDAESKKIDAEMSKKLGGEMEKLSITKKTADLVKKKAKGLVKGMKDEVHEWKEAGIGLTKLAKGKEINDHEKKAIKAVAIHTALVVGSMAMTGGLSGGAAAIAKGLGIHFAEHSLLVRGAHALAFAKAVEEGDDKAAEEALEAMVNEFAEFIQTHGK